MKERATFSLFLSFGRTGECMNVYMLNTISVRLTLTSHVALHLIALPLFLFCRNTFESLNWFLCFYVSCYFCCSHPSSCRMLRSLWSRKKKCWFEESFKAQLRVKDIIDSIIGFKLDFSHNLRCCQIKMHIYKKECNAPFEKLEQDHEPVQSINV